MIAELGSLLSDDSYLRSQHIRSTAAALLQKARNSVPGADDLQHLRPDPPRTLVWLGEE